MQRTLTAFVLGIFTAAIAAALAGTRLPAVMLGLGFIAALLVVLASLGSAKRLYAAAERLHQLAEWIEAKPQRRSRRRKESHNNAIVMPDSREPELVSALVNLGSKRASALNAARYALQQAEPGATVPDLVRIAVKAPQVAA